MSKDKLPKAPKTMEVPKTLTVRINDGILEPTDKRGSVSQILFKHMHDSMNDRNALDVFKEIAKAHGIAVEVADAE